jgi:hypothetical protein
MDYIELPSDHAFTAFLSRITPSAALRDRELNFSKEELKRQRFLREKARVEIARRNELYPYPNTEQRSAA